MGEEFLEQRGMVRKDFLKLGGATFLAGTALVGCDLLSTEPEQKKESGDRNGAEGQRGKGKESPQLTERVKNGELPPVEERLPEEPVVVEPVERVGQYGGEWNTATTGTADTPWLGYTVGYENPLNLDLDSGELVPNIVESFEANEDGTDFLLRLRRGMRWSDGKPFTADDLVFAVEDVLLNEEISPVAPEWMVGGEEPGGVEKEGDYAVRFTFSGSNGPFLQNLAAATGRSLISNPRHYLEQFHKDYNPDVGELAEEAGATDWIELFFQKANVWENTDLPTLQPWAMTRPLAEGGNRAVAERNPYYWKVDPDGSQLPYIDRVLFDFIQDEEVMLSRALNGDIDMHMRHFNTLRNKPVLAENRERGEYRFFEIVPELMCTDIISLNLTHKDPVKREIFRNKDFRIGLSHAINRQEIIDVVYVSQGEPYQSAPRPESEFYDEEMAKQYTEYDVDRANEYLDRAFQEKNDEGIRIGPDGNPISFDVEVALGFLPEEVDVMELVRGYWREVGVDMRVKTEERSLFVERVVANDHDATIWGGDGGSVDILLRPRFYVPTGHNSRCDYAIAWADWYNSGGRGRRGAAGEDKRAYKALRSGQGYD